MSDFTIRASAETSIYTDDDNVDVITPVIACTIEHPTAGVSVSGHYLVDVVTAASADIIATASPPWTEVRQAGALDAAYKWGDFGVGAGGSLSVEPDYLSVSVGANGSLELRQKSLTLLLGYTYGNDTAGRSDAPFDVFSRTMERHSLSAGVSVILNRSAIASAIFDTILERGDQSKPYRYVPMFDEGTASEVPPGASVDLVDTSRLHVRPLEALPLSRDRYALTGRFAYRFAASTLRAEERVYSDSWGIKASTTDLKYIHDIGRLVSVWPHTRAHAQSGADFWQRAYEASRTTSGAISIPSVRTGDRELGPLFTFTGGGGVSVRTGPRFTVSLQVEGSFTKYFDALYLTQRRALFSALSAQAVFD